MFLDTNLRARARDDGAQAKGPSVRHKQGRFVCEHNIIMCTHLMMAVRIIVNA
jgi:hypothetical protein